MADTNGDGAASIVDLVEAQATESPLGIAVEGNGERLTYEDLQARANHLAARLQQLGVGPDVPVAICAPRSLDTMVAVLGVLKAGGAYLPLDPAYPRERLAFMLADAKPALVLAHSETAGLLPPYAPLLCLDRPSDNLHGEQSDPPPRAVGPDHLAYVIYTSGSTGQPKGVAMVHRALVNLIQWQGQSSGAWGRERTLQLTPLSFDVSFQEIFATWAAGGTLVLADEEVRRDPQSLLQVLSRNEVRRLFLPFVALQQLAEVALRQGPMPYELREVITAGEALRITRHLVDLFQRLPGCTLHNQYGPSETHVVTAYKLQGPPNHWPALPPIGRALPGVSLLIRDDAGQASTEGELYVAGQALARGYLGHPELTEARFVIDSATGLRCYRTGDWVRLRDDGDLDFLGRKDDQVKLRGFRIELGEVEAALNAQPGVAHAAVALREDEPGERRLVGYVVFEGEAAPSTTACSDMRRVLQTKLPEHMVPAAIISLSALPRTPSGKVDRRALPRPEGARPALDVPYQAPGTAIEIEIARVWQRLLDLDRVGIHDSFFDLGGTSLLAVRGALDLRGILGRDISPGEILRHPTVFELARFLEQGEPDDRPSQPAVRVEAK